VAVAGIGNRSSVMFLKLVGKIWKWREAICGEHSTNFIGSIFLS
jgi:hypothetical protein